MDITMAGTGAGSSRNGQVQVRFTTNSPDIELAEGKRQLLVPTNLRRYQLSQILNSESMLDTNAAIPFDFLINGTYLQTDLEQYLTANGLSSEKTLTLEYVRALIPPQHQATFEHDDWVSCVDLLSSAGQLGQERIASGSYDGLLRIWNKSGQAIATSASYSAGGHTGGIKSAKFISPSQIASSGLDRTIRIWKYSEAEDHFSGELKPILELYGHEKSIDSIAVHAPSNRILSASADGSVGLWTTDKIKAPEADADRVAPVPNAKRRKLTTSTSTPQRGPLSLISAHTAQVSAVIFNPLDHTFAYSASEDRTVRTFDLTTSSVVQTFQTSNPILSLTALPGKNILAAGTTARHITLIDPRANAQSSQVMTLRGHANKVVSIAPDPASTWGLVSGSHDGDCRIWDLRSSRQATREEGSSGRVGESVWVIGRESTKGKKKPVAGEGIKVFGVAWDNEVGIVSGSEDKTVQINGGSGIIKK